jgi:hypothetical protein
MNIDETTETVARQLGQVIGAKALEQAQREVMLNLGGIKDYIDSRGLHKTCVDIGGLPDGKPNRIHLNALVFKLQEVLINARKTQLVETMTSDYLRKIGQDMI